MKNIVEGSARRARSMRRAALATGLTAAVLLPVLVSAGSGSAAAPPPAHPGPTGPNTVGLKTVGPIDETNGFPLWYKDTSGQRLELCLDASDPYCIMGAVPTPGAPLVFPTNFPDEAFWSMADASLATNATGGSAILVTGLEAAFAADVAPGQQISFGRIRLRVSGTMQDGAEYKITHPFGVDTYTAEAGNGNIAGAARGINVTEDIGDLAGGSTFEAALGSRPAPFLKWDPTIARRRRPGHLGDPTVDHQVTGSPYGTNIFRIEGPVGAFTGSPDLCADPALGDKPDGDRRLHRDEPVHGHGQDGDPRRRAGDQGRHHQRTAQATSSTCSPSPSRARPWSSPGPASPPRRCARTATAPTTGASASTAQPRLTWP